MGEVGWLKKDDNPHSDPNGYPKPAWTFASPKAVAFEQTQREAGKHLARHKK